MRSARHLLVVLSIAALGSDWGQREVRWALDEAEEAAYRRSLEIETQLNNRAGQASSLNQLGRLYGDYLHRPEEAATFSRQAADIFVEMEDLRLEGVTRNNIADTLRQLGRYAEARTEIRRAIDSDAPDSRKRLMQAVLAIFNGARDPALRQSSGQALADAAEILFLLERGWGARVCS